MEDGTSSTGGTKHPRCASRILPASAILNPDTLILREYTDLIGDSSNSSHALLVFPEIDRDVLNSMRDLVRNNREWEMPVKRRLSSLFKWQVNPRTLEMLMRHCLVVAPYANKGHSSRDNVNRERILRTAYSIQLARGAFDVEWNDETSLQAKGCAVVASIAADQKALVKSLTPEDASWVGQNADAIFLLLPVLRERQWFTRSLIEPFLEAKAYALAAGSL